VRGRTGPGWLTPGGRPAPPMGRPAPPMGRPVPPRPAAPRGDYPLWRRKIATAFWPPKPNPLTITVSTFAFRAFRGT